MGKGKQSKSPRNSAPEKPAQPPRQAPRLQDPRIIYSVLGVLLFFLIALQGGGSDKIIAIGMAVVLVGASIGRRPMENMAQRLSIPVLAIFAYVLLNAAAGLYARFGSFAVGEFGKIFAAFSACAIVLFRLRRENAMPFAAMAATVTGAFALISIDASSLKLLIRPFVAMMDAMGCVYAEMTIGYETGTRVTGVFGNANILAGILAFGVFLSLCLVYQTKSERGRLGACLLLCVNALGFLLAFSMGAIAMFAVAVAVYLLAAGKGDRLPMLVLMVETAVLVLVLTALSFPGLGATGLRSAIPVLAGPVGGVLLWLVQHTLGTRLSKGLNAHPKAAGAALCTVIVLAACYVVLGYNLTTAYTLHAGETLRRSVYPAAGAYTVSAEMTGDMGAVAVTVESQDESQTMMHKSTVLYQGTLQGAAFTVPEGAKVVYLSFSTSGEATLSRVALSDGTEVPLGYRLLPGFIANRIQGLWANQNAIQRTVFYRDGLRMFAKSPIIGSGLGSVEGMVTSVQDFYYESRYVHNQYIQVLAEMGVVGIACFVAMLGTAAFTLVRRRREEETAHSPLLPALCACLAMMACHGAVEAVWSVSVYQTMALLLLMAMAVCYGKPVRKLAAKGAAIIASAAVWVFTVVFACLLGGHISAERAYREVNSGQRQQTPYTMTELARRDKYAWVQYKLDMAVNASDSVVPEFAQTAAKYADQLRKLEIYSVDYSLALYHYATLGQWDQAFAATREGILQAASVSENWQALFSFYESIFPGEGAENASWFAQQSLMLYSMLQDYNDGRMEQILLTEQNSAFIARMQAVAPAVS